jgi:hypothetical protein
MALDDRKEIARFLITAGTDEMDLEGEPTLAGLPVAATLAAPLTIPFPDGLAPIPQPMDPSPALDDPLPAANVVVITWTVDENDGLADVFTPGFNRKAWYRYTRNFDQYKPQIRDGAPSLQARPPRLGSYFPLRIGNLGVLCFKSELHLNQDGIEAQPGLASLPVKDLFKQIIQETGATLVATIGTAGSVFEDFSLGDVVVTRAAKFRCTKEFRNQPYNGQIFKSEWDIPTDRLAKAQELMQGFAKDLAEPPLGPPSARFPFAGPLIDPPPNVPRIRLDGRDMAEFHPILTTDYFEYGTSTNHLEEQGCAVEMGDAALGLAVLEMDHPTDWVVVRNMSDPQINGALPTREFHLNAQTMWAVSYYEAYGRYTSRMGALATWGVVAGLAT